MNISYLLMCEQALSCLNMAESLKHPNLVLNPEQMINHRRLPNSVIVRYD